MKKVSALTLNEARIPAGSRFLQVYELVDENRETTSIS